MWAMHQHDDIPTPEEFEATRKRELARLNLRLTDITGEKFFTQEDRAILEGDTPRQETQDREIVRRWATTKDQRVERPAKILLSDSSPR